jgi:hypothetical protein
MEENPLFNILITSPKFNHLFQQIQQHRWTVCLPTLSPSSPPLSTTNQPAVLSHWPSGGSEWKGVDERYLKSMVLKPSPYFKEEYTTMCERFTVIIDKVARCLVVKDSGCGMALLL